jgi:hypothetical protein
MILEDPERRRARMESYRNFGEPILRGLARGDIKPGDSIEALAKAYPDYTFSRSGVYAVLSRSNGFGGTSLIAKDAKLVYASTCSCTYHDEFFNTTTKEEWDACSEESEATRRKNGLPPAKPIGVLDDAIPPPREVGK